jgi:Flp pilus assembly pilin Flp
VSDHSSKRSRLHAAAAGSPEFPNSDDDLLATLRHGGGVVKRFFAWCLRSHEERGAQMVEYAFLLFFIALVVLAAVALIGERVNLLFFIRARDCIVNGSC